MSLPWVRRLSPALLIVFVFSGLELSSAAAAGGPVVPVAKAGAAKVESRPDAVSAMLSSRAQGVRSVREAYRPLHRLGKRAVTRSRSLMYSARRSYRRTAARIAYNLGSIYKTWRGW